MSASALSRLSRQELEARLEEAEETLRAIRDGEIDAVVVKDGLNEQVFTLEGSEHSYRTFMEAMDIGAAAFDDEGHAIYANQALCSLLERPAQDLHGRALVELLDAANQTRFRQLLQQATRQRLSVEIHFRIDETERSALVTGTPLDFGVIKGVAVTFTDLSEREQAAAARESERLARAILTSANEAVVVCDLNGQITHLNAAAERICALNPVGRIFDEAVELSFPDASGLISGGDIVAMAATGTPTQGIEAAVKSRVSTVTDVLISAAPLVVSGNRIRGCVVTLIDLSQRKVAERRQELLMFELDHRVKNTLAMVLAICTRTAAHELSIDAFKKAFAGRIQALAATHTLLSNASWENLAIQDVLGAEIAPYATVPGGRIVAEGLDIKVDARTAVSLGLIFHELTTNAVKYGALSTPEGRVSVRRMEGPDGALLIEWRESDGPPVAPPRSAGFGKTLILRSLSGARLDFDPEGVVCRIALSRDMVRTAH